MKKRPPKSEKAVNDTDTYCIIIGLDHNTKSTGTHAFKVKQNDLLVLLKGIVSCNKMTF
jgi:hypothetical protein